jgi:hypothetical protein
LYAISLFIIYPFLSDPLISITILPIAIGTMKTHHRILQLSNDKTIPIAFGIQCFEKPKDSIPVTVQNELKGSNLPSYNGQPFWLVIVF